MNYDGYLFNSAPAYWHYFMLSTCHHALRILPGKTISAYRVTWIILYVVIIWLFCLFVCKPSELYPTFQKVPCYLLIIYCLIVTVVRFPIFRSNLFFTLMRFMQRTNSIYLKSTWLYKITRFYL